MTTLETITTKQIKALREEAMAAGDYRQVDICDVALATREDHDEQTAETLLGPAGEPMTRSEARAECARVIADAEASQAASSLGRRGRAVNSEAQQAAARANGAKGGRPRRAHFSRFGVAIQPPEADSEGYLAYRSGYEELPEAEQTAAERWISAQEQRIADWRDGK